MTVGGTGFLVLRYKGHHLAYLYPGVLTPEGNRAKVPSEVHQSRGTFYEIWDEPGWERMRKDSGCSNLMDALQREANRGTLGLFKFTKSPTDGVLTRTFDLTEAQVRGEGTETVAINGQQVSKILAFESADGTPLVAGPLQYEAISRTKVVATFWSGMSLHDELIQKIKQGMAHQNVTQCELSRRTGVPQGNISRLLKGERPGTSLDTWDKLLRAVGAR